MIERLRAQRVEVLRDLAAGRPHAGGGLVGRARAARDLARPVRHRHRHARGRGAAGRRPRRTAGAGGGRVRAAPGAVAAPPGHRRQSRQPDRRMALRPAHLRLRAAPGDGPPRGPEAHERPHDGAGLRPRASPARRCPSPWTSSPPGWWRWWRASPRPPCSPAIAWWAPLLLAGAWLATHWLLRESAVWRDRNTEEVREAQRHADYAYRLAVEPPAAKELRLFGLAGWTVERFRSRRRRLFELQWQATRLRERPVVWSLLLVLAANIVVFWSLASAAADGALALDRVVTYATRRRHHQHDRLRRAVVGARRRRRARRGGAAPRGGDGPRRFAGPRHPAGRRACRRARSAFATSPSPTRPRASRCSRASISRSPPGRRSPSSARTAPARRRSPSSSAGSTTPRPAPSRSTASTSASSTSMPGGRG